LFDQADLVSNGEEALVACQKENYDVILMDVQMPVMDGLEATRRLRARMPVHGPYIVALTASAMAGDQDRCLASGMDMYLVKPIDLQRLKATLGRCSEPRGSQVLDSGTDDRRSAMDAAPAQLSSPSGLPGLQSLDTDFPVPGMPADTVEGAAADADAGVLDEHALEVVREMGLLSSLVDTYFSSVPLTLQHLRSALSAGDLSSAVVAAHTARGANGSVGAFRLAALLRELETLANARVSAPELETKYAEVEHEYRRVARVLRRISARKPVSLPV
jgi:CheY-like chemotaxis protein